MGFFCCTRCGTCCRKGGPAFHSEDVDLVSRLGITNMVCLRRGELAYDPQVNAVRPLDVELIKIRGKGHSWECVFFDSEIQVCSIYEHRPIECRVLQCDDSVKIFDTIRKPHLNRSHIVRPNCVLWDCIIEHERLFPIETAVKLNQNMKESSSSLELDVFVRKELYFRRAFADRVQVADAELWPYFGRPLWLVLLPLRPELRKFGDEYIESNH